MANLKTGYLGLDLKNPIIVGSSGLTYSINGIKKLETLGAGAVVLKSIFEEQILVETKEAVYNTELTKHPDAEGYFSNLTKEHGIEQYLELIEQAKNETGIPIIASVNCYTSGDWIEFAKQVESAGADALELNVLITDFFPDKKGEDIENIYFKIIKKIKSSIDIPISLKTGLFFSNPIQMLIKLGQSGIKGLTLFNRYFSPDIDIEEMKLIPGSSYSTPDEFSIPLRWIALTSDVIKCDISATTGIHDGYSAIKMLLVGADTVQVCSTLYKNGIKHLETIINQMNSWLDKHNYNSIEEIKGLMKCEDDKQRELFARSQFMKHYMGNVKK